MTVILSKIITALTNANVPKEKCDLIVSPPRYMTTDEMIEYDLRNYKSITDPQAKLLCEEFGGGTISELKQNMINQAYILKFDNFVKIREEVGQPTKCLNFSIIY